MRRVFRVFRAVFVGIIAVCTSASHAGAQDTGSAHERRNEGIIAGLRAFTAETPVSVQPVIAFREPIQLNPVEVSSKSPAFRVGCAIRQYDCPRASRDDTGTRCTGWLVTADTAPSAMPTEGVHIEKPARPRQLPDGTELQALVLVHVDRSGWICGAALLQGTSVPVIDQAVLRSVTRWRIQPARLGNEPVEALHRLAVTLSSR